MEVEVFLFFVFSLYKWFSTSKLYVGANALVCNLYRINVEFLIDVVNLFPVFIQDHLPLSSSGRNPLDRQFSWECGSDIMYNDHMAQGLEPLAKDYMVSVLIVQRSPSKVIWLGRIV